EARDAARYLIAHPVPEKSEYLYYGLYVTTHAAYEAGDSALPAVSKQNFSRCLKLQQPDGGWPATPEGPGRAYTTAMALMKVTIRKFSRSAKNLPIMILPKCHSV